MASLKGILGTDVVSRADAETLGRIEGAVLDVPSRSILAWQIGKGRKAVFVDHSHLTGIGNAAAVVDTAESLRAAAGPVEEATVKGWSVLGSLMLSEAGDSLGNVVDAEVDTSSGTVTLIRSGAVQVPADLMLGFGSFALVVGLPR